MESPAQQQRNSLGSESLRRKKNATRTRVTRACDRCKRKKIRCTGAQPCEICIQAATSCTYNANYARGRRPTIPTASPAVGSRPAASPVSVRHSNGADGDAIHGETPDGSDTVVGSDGIPKVDAVMMDRRQDQPQQAYHDIDGKDHNAVSGVETPGATPSIRVQQDTPSRSLGPSATQPVPSSRNSPEPSQTDRQGHYVGPASGVSFLLRVQRRLHQALTFSPGTSIFTFGDAPLPDFDPTFFVMPPREEAQRLVDRYFDFAVPTHRFLHRPTVNTYLREFYETMGYMRTDDDAAAKTALLFMVLAQAKEYMPFTTANDVSARYFHMAEHQLSKERGEVRLASVQARLCQCFYLLSLSRINHCWSLFGTMAHLALAIGLNRSRRADPANGYTNIDIECRKRVFWCAYSLDNYLSAALGRPRTFHDKDIDAPLPSCIEDVDLHQATPVGQPPPPISKRGHSLMLAAVAHVRLSRIVSRILEDLYPIRPISSSTRSTVTTKCSKDLEMWHEEMARFLDMDGMDAALLLPIYQRQKNVLNLAYWHATILTHRPFLLSSFASLQQSGASDKNTSHRAQMETSVRKCLEAAMNIVGLVDELVQSHQMFRAFWFTSYFAFSAVVVLYVYIIQQSSTSAHNYRTYLDAATKCQAQLSDVATKESLAHRYVLVLEEFRLEVVRRMEQAAQRSHELAPGGVGAGVPQGLHSQRQNLGPAVNGHDGLMNGTGGGYDQFTGSDGMVDFNYSPSSSLADMTSWGNFDSMVTSGFGQLEALLNSGETFGFT